MCNTVQDTLYLSFYMPDEYFVFSVCFFVLSYKILFWSERSVSLGVLLLTSSCALAMTQLIHPHTHDVLIGAFSDRMNDLPPQASSFGNVWAHFSQNIPSAQFFSFWRQS